MPDIEADKVQHVSATGEIRDNVLSIIVAKPEENGLSATCQNVALASAVDVVAAVTANDGFVTLFAKKSVLLGAAINEFARLRRKFGHGRCRRPHG